METEPIREQETIEEVRTDIEPGTRPDEAEGTDNVQERAELSMNEDEQQVKERVLGEMIVEKGSTLLPNFDEKKDDLSHALEALAQEYETEAIMVESTVKRSGDKDAYREQLTRLLTTYHKTESNLLYASVNYALICMVYYSPAVN